MTRFYCTICKTVKRVRVMPNDVERSDAKDPVNRIGTCRRHHGELLQPRKAHVAHTKKSKSIQQPSKPKKGRHDDRT